MTRLYEQIGDLPRVARAIARRHDMILVDEQRKPKEHAVNLHWWKYSAGRQNIGDMLSPVVVKYMIEVLRLPERTSATKHLYAIGSIIDGGYQDATVWGSGVLKGERKWWWRFFRKLDIRCVRGPETQKVLQNNGYNCPEIYGDPAILMPRIYPAPLHITKEYEYRVVRHYVYDQNSENSLSPITSDWKAFIHEILKSKLIISSSLHGIILAEAYGIPAILLKEQDMNLFKYRDYYFSTERYEFPIATSVEEALTITPAPLPDLEKLRDGLISTFPVDLWE